DYRGGGRSSGRETAARVAAGAIASTFLRELGIRVTAYTRSIGDIEIAPDQMDLKEALNNNLCMPDRAAYERSAAYLQGLIESRNSAGGVIECRIDGLPPGIGETVFDKLDASLASAILSIGGVKGFEIGDGFGAAKSTGIDNNDGFTCENGRIRKTSNHSGGTLGGMSDGSEILFRAAVKPTPSIAMKQETVNRDGSFRELSIKGRHDPLIVPRAVVVVESMAAIVVADLLLCNMSARMDRIRTFYQ
ncbi:MAG: chorismate synthase, partial [Lachnospiraceae bacterium]|nr:chorismate synthase [Lachnospiraceae bacterium]